MSFNDFLLKHLNSIKNKDLDSFISTVKLDEVTLIMPNGTFIGKEEEFVEFHKSWFEDNDWSLNYEILKVEESKEMSYALLKIDYKDCDSEGHSVYMNYYLNLIFRRHDEQWFLIYDQNTLCK